MDRRSRLPRVEPVADRRRLLRRPVEIHAELTGSLLPRRRKVVLADISPHGARVRTPDRFHVDDFVLLCLPSTGPLGARVAWTAEGEIGLGFAAELHPAIIAHVLSLPQSDCPIERRWRGETDGETACPARAPGPAISA